ncbi:MAG: Flp pilus assembly protein CpaB [Eggerthellaceae bacterium]|nr:Flp pilus assembly protein CpaB [Eggerthellaceae bacterium]
MKQRHLTIAAVACGTLCAACVAGFLWNVQGEANAARAEVLARYGGEQVEVCVATRDVAAGERLDASAVETKLWIADLLPEQAVSDSMAAVGRTATSSILKGEVISERRFQEGPGALDIPQGFDAVSVPTKAVQAVGGAIRPGMSVDVYSLGSSGTTPLAQNVIVLATSVGESGSLVSNDSGWITLAVAPERVEEIIAASGKTNLYFALPGNMPSQAADDTAQEGSQPESGSSAPADQPAGQSEGNAAEQDQPSAEASSASAAPEASSEAQSAEAGSSPDAAEAGQADSDDEE